MLEMSLQPPFVNHGMSKTNCLTQSTKILPLSIVGGMLANQKVQDSQFLESIVIYIKQPIDTN